MAQLGLVSEVGAERSLDFLAMRCLGNPGLPAGVGTVLGGDQRPPYASLAGAAGRQAHLLPGRGRGLPRDGGQVSVSGYVAFRSTMARDVAGWAPCVPETASLREPWARPRCPAGCGPALGAESSDSCAKKVALLCSVKANWAAVRLASFFCCFWCFISLGFALVFEKGPPMHSDKFPCHHLMSWGAGGGVTSRSQSSREASLSPPL